MEKGQLKQVKMEMAEAALRIERQSNNPYMHVETKIKNNEKYEFDRKYRIHINRKHRSIVEKEEEITQTSV